MVVQINESALRHGVAEEDIHRALSTVVFDGLLPQYANNFCSLALTGIAICLR
jgi:hypothetical protein